MLVDILNIYLLEWLPTTNKGSYNILKEIPVASYLDANHTELMECVKRIMFYWFAQIF